MLDRTKYPYLVADIGGTHARCALVTGPQEHNGYRFRQPQVYDCTQFDSIKTALNTYMDSVPAPRPTSACIAIAGPVNNDEVCFTNLDWNFSISKLRGALNLHHLEVMNDLAAIACASRRFPIESYRSIIAGEALAHAPSVVIGLGTGLGVATLLPVNGGWEPVAGEGGHAGLAPADEYELEILHLAARDLPHVSAESLLSGPGLLRLYRILALIHGDPAPLNTPADITSNAATGNDALSCATVQAFTRLLGGFCANVVLTCGAWGGVHLTGNILRQIEPQLHSGGFSLHFRGNSVMRNNLSKVPVDLIDADHPGLVGAATWLESKIGTR